MFDAHVYSSRREALKKQFSSGILLFPGNVEAPFNYLSNTYHFRQDSSFLYFFGLNLPGLFGYIDIDSGKDYIFGNDFDLDDIIWMGPQPALVDLAMLAKISNTGSLDDLQKTITGAVSKGQKIHLLPPYRGENFIQLANLLKIDHRNVSSFISEDLIRAVVHLRSVKEPDEIVEIEKALDTAFLMHTTAMKMAMPGIVEEEIAGRIEGIALSGGGPVSFPIILSINGETLHNHQHKNVLQAGRMMVTDAGCETSMGYCSDITRTVPVGGKFSQQQMDIYQIVLQANLKVIEHCKPGIFYREMHLLASKTIASGLKELGLMRGNIDDAVVQGAHALFFPHGIGHMMGLDVHDMENLGEKFVGYDIETERSKQFGLSFLRLGRRLQQGFVITDEPGIYFIPALIEQWKGESRFSEYINYHKVEQYMGIGGIRIEDDLLITEAGCRVLGKPIPKMVNEIEAIMKIK
jgi:Xaa-Pro aminopeptidase